MEKKDSLIERKLALRYLLSQIFGNPELSEMLEGITGKPEPQVAQPVTRQESAPPTRFKALREKLAQQDAPEVEASNDNDGQ